MNSRHSKLNALHNEKTTTLYIIGSFAIAGFIALWFRNLGFAYTSFVVIALLSIGVSVEHKHRRQKIEEEYRGD